MPKRALITDQCVAALHRQRSDVPPDSSPKTWVQVASEIGIEPSLFHYILHRKRGVGAENVARLSTYCQLPPADVFSVN